MVFLFIELPLFLFILSKLFPRFGKALLVIYFLVVGYVILFVGNIYVDLSGMRHGETWIKIERFTNYTLFFLPTVVAVFRLFWEKE